MMEYFLKCKTFSVIKNTNKAPSKIQIPAKMSLIKKELQSQIYTSGLDPKLLIMYNSLYPLYLLLLSFNHLLGTCLNQ